MAAELPAPWPPTRYTPPLAPDFPSLYDRYAAIVDMAWRAAFGYALEAWQVSLLRAMLELYPAGHPRAGQLRWRSVIASLGRQNGKTEVAAALGLIGLLRSASPTIVGLAQTVESANLIYRRTMQAITRNPALAARFTTSGTRGIRSAAGARYDLRPAKSAALQGIPIDLALADELHLLKGEVWADLVNGTGGRPDTLVAGITTAGDADSKLLIRLYQSAAEAISATPEDAADGRFGAWVWEAPGDSIPDDDAEFLAWLAAANPSLASGRLDAETIVSDARSLPTADVLRYRGNRFLTSSASPFLEPGKWASCARPAGGDWPAGLRPVFALDRTPDWGFASIVAAAKAADGTIHTELVASLAAPTIEQLARLAVDLRRHNPLAYAMDRYALGDLGVDLKRRGLTVRLGSQADAVNSASMLYAKVARKQLQHAADPLLSQQVPHAIRKNLGSAYRITRSGAAVEVDAVLATALAVLVAETTADAGPQVF